MDLEKRNFLFYDSCRLCLEELGSCNIFIETHLPRDIFVCTGVNVSVTDDLPEKICKTCYDIIKRAIDFRELVAKNDLLLRSLLADTKNEEVNEISSYHNSNEQIKSRYFDNDVKNEKSKKIFNEFDQDSNRTFGSENLNCTSSEPLKTISIRKDLFPSSVQNSPTKDRDSQDNVEQKRMKIEKTEVVEYRCSVCCKNYDTWKKLYLHSRLHNKNMLCPLDACEKKFATKGDLEKHIRTHTGEKPYQCSLCDRSFTQRVSLKSHVETVHSGETSNILGA